MGDPSIEVCDGHCHHDWEKKIICFFQVTEEMLDKSSEERGLAMSAVSDGMTKISFHLIILLLFIMSMNIITGDLEKAIQHFTNAIKNNPQSALLYAKRGRLVHSLLQ